MNSFENRGTSVSPKVRSFRNMYIVTLLLFKMHSRTRHKYIIISTIKYVKCGNMKYFTQRAFKSYVYQILPIDITGSQTKDHKNL